MNIADVVDLSNLLAELAAVKRATKLPNGDNEPDSHHSFSLALIAYDICRQQCPELNIEKVLLFALVHDLLEVVTGDEDTLHYDQVALAAKQQREERAMQEFNEVFARYPALRTALADYDKLDTPEAATVFVLDKACTTWTHFHDNGDHARGNRNIKTPQDVAGWADRQRQKIQSRLKVTPPAAIMKVYEDSFLALQGLFNED